MYDSAGRLVKDSMNGAVFHAFTYDANSNWHTFVSGSDTVTYSYDAQDRLRTAVHGSDTTTYIYGSNGELKTKSVPGVGTTAYAYDALGNLVRVVLPDSTEITYVIDGQNRRVGRKVNGVLVKGWLYQNRLNPVVELDSSGDVASRFVYAARGNVPDYMEKNGVTYRLVSDHLGSVRLVVDTATGTVAQQIDYDEWGNVIQNTNPGFQPFGFAGGLIDDSTGLVRFGARDYDPAVGRWSAKDPVGFSGGDANLYAYAINDPVNLSDPTGQCLGEDHACKNALREVGIDAVADALKLKIFKGLGKIFRAARLARSAEAIERIAANPTTVSRLAHHARGFERAAQLEAEALRLTAVGGVQYVAGGGLTSRQIALSFLNDTPWWYDGAKFVPGLGFGMDIGEAINLCLLE